MFMAGALIVGFIGPMDQIMSFLLIFEFRVNQELTKGHMDFFYVIIGFFIQKNMGLETKILSLSILAK